MKKPKKVRARKFWGYPAQVKSGDAYVTTKRLRASQDVRLFVLPCTVESYEAMLWQAYLALHNEGAMKPICWSHEWRENVIKEILASIGITRPAK